MDTQVSSYEYKNDYLYIVIRQAPEAGPQAYTYCCGINIQRFDPICWGKAGICSNPAFKGLQLLRADVSAFALKLGLLPLNREKDPCSTMAPPGDGWYRETALLLDHASPQAVRTILEFSVMTLVRTVLTVCAPDARMPAQLPTPPAMQRFLESMSVQDYRAAAPPPIAKQENKS